MGRWIVAVALGSCVVACNGGGGDDGGDAADGADGAMTSDGGSGDGGSVDGVGDGVDDGVDDGADDGGVDGGSQCDTDADCMDGTCVELVPGGVRVCVLPVVEATDCPLDPNGEEPPHQCCETSECAMGICTGNQFGPVCSGAEQISFNICLDDQCATHDDCGDGQACIPAGALRFPVASCLAVACLQDSDCTDGPGGACVVEPSTTCCGDFTPRCRYPDSPPIGDECPP